MLPNREKLLVKVDELPEPPVAIEAFWDGDSDGWRVVLVAVLRAKPNHHLVTLRDWSGAEATLAAMVGGELGKRFGVPFYFPSPDYPEDDCPAWADRDRGYPCRRCGILLLQGDDCPWRGMCYHCHNLEVSSASAR